MCSHLSTQACDIHGQEKRYRYFLNVVSRNPTHQRWVITDSRGQYMACSCHCSAGDLGKSAGEGLPTSVKLTQFHGGQRSLDTLRRWLCERGYISGHCVTRWPLPRACHLDSCLSLSHLCAPEMTELRDLAVTDQR